MTHSENEPSDDFVQLIAAARSGDEEAMSSLLDSTRDYLLAVANQEFDRDLQAKLGASDVVQESMIRAHAAIEQFAGDSRAEFLAWLRSILKNDMRHARRHFKGLQKRAVGREQSQPKDADQPSPELLDGDRTPSTRAAAEEETRLLANAMEQLPAEYQQVLQLRNWEQLSFSDIGDIMQRSAEAARKLWARAVKQLQSILEDSNDD